MAEESRAPPPASRLCDDLLLEIFLRLSSLATLVRAACVCAAWQRTVASSPEFRRRFRSLHSPPLLGLLFTSEAVSPTFVPALHHCPDLAAAVRGGGFSLPSLPAGGGDWQVLSNTCRLGNLLLYNWEDELLAKLNPLSRQSERVVPDLASKNTEGYFVGVLLSSSEEDDDDDGPRVMLVDHPGSKMKATIFSMDTGCICSATPWVDVPACPDQVDGYVLYGMAVQLNGSVYYLLNDWRYIACIDTATMEIVVIELPQCVSRSFCVGETKGGATCLVYSDGLKVGVLMHTRDEDAQKWVLDRVVSMDSELQRVLPAGQFDVLHVFEVRDGYVYLSTPATLVQDPGKCYWILSLCLETMKLEKLFQGRNGIPYIMPWPRSLIGW